MDNTLFIYIAGDNGASAEGSMVGLFNEVSFFNGVPEQLEDVLRYIDTWGDPTTYPHYAVGWAIAGNTPFVGQAGRLELRRHAQWHGDPLAQGYQGEGRAAPPVAPCGGHRAHGAGGGGATVPARGQRHHTEAVRGREPGVHVQRCAGAGPPPHAVLRDRRQPGHLPRRLARGTVHRAPWEPQPRAALDQDKWELYDTRQDFSLAHDLAAQNPQKLKEMQALFLQEAVTYNVLPIDDRSIERFNPAIAGRPDLMGGRTALTVYEGMTGMMENAFINVKNRSHTITAEVDIPPGGAHGGPGAGRALRGLEPLLHGRQAGVRP